MNIYEAMFLIQFLIIVAILCIKLFNIFNAGLFYPHSISWVLFIAFFIFYAVGFIVTVSEPNIMSGDNPTILYSSLLTLETWLIVLNVLFQIIEVMFLLGTFAQKPIKAFKSKDNIFNSRLNSR